MSEKQGRQDLESGIRIINNTGVGRGIETNLTGTKHFCEQGI